MADNAERRPHVPARFNSCHFSFSFECILRSSCASVRRLGLRQRRLALRDFRQVLRLVLLQRCADAITVADRVLGCLPWMAPALRGSRLVERSRDSPALEADRQRLIKLRPKAGSARPAGTLRCLTRLSTITSTREHNDA
jgi:hypothetical protein